MFISNDLLLKILWEKEKNCCDQHLSFSNNVFHPIKVELHHFYGTNFVIHFLQNTFNLDKGHMFLCLLNPLPHNPYF